MMPLGGQQGGADGLLDAAPCGFLRFGDDGTVEVVNLTLCEWLGYERGELEGGSVTKVLSGGAKVFFQTHFFPLLRLKGKAEEIYLSVRHSCGEVLPVMVNAVRHSAPAGEVNDCVIIPMRHRARYEEEILLRKKEAERISREKDEMLEALQLAEGELRARSNELETLMREVPVSIFIGYGHDCEVIRGNPAAHALLGATGPQPAGVAPVEGLVFVLERDGERIADGDLPMQRAAATGEPVPEQEWDLVRPGGERRRILGSAVPLFDDAGAVRGSLATFTDITAQRRASQALERAKEATEAASRAKDDFLAALSHELRTPLAPVLMVATSLLEHRALAPELREDIELVRRNVELEALLIDDLLDLTRINRGKLSLAPEVVDVHELLGHARAMLRGDPRRRDLLLTSRLDAGRHHARADPTRIQQVFWNLIKNAVKFTPAGGEVEIATRNDDRGRIVVSVRDTGIGISQDKLDSIFDPFEQGDLSGEHRFGGLGLGLAISRAIARAHGAELRADSRGRGLGATFTVTLATAEAPAPAPAPGAAPGPARAAPDRLRVLVIEDHASTRDVLARLLRDRGHAVTPVASAAAARAAFAPAAFDLILSDIGLGDGCGVELIAEFRRSSEVPAIALSGYGMDEDLRRFEAAGFTAHLVKPIRPDSLWATIEDVVRRGGSGARL